MRAAPVLAAMVCAAATLAACGGGAPASGGSDDEAVPGGSGVGGAASVPVSVRGTAPSEVGGVPSIVALAPVGSTGAGSRTAGTGPSAPARGDDAVIDQFGLAFSPRVLVVAAGSPVRFTNSEGAITHNVHIRSVDGDSTVFNGDTGPSEGVDVELPGPGGYDVLCDMHPGMVAFVFVTDAPWAVAADPDGTFELRGLPDGAYDARAWSAETGFGSVQRVRIDGGPAHLNVAGPR